MGFALTMVFASKRVLNQALVPGTALLSVLQPKNLALPLTGSAGIACPLCAMLVSGDTSTTWLSEEPPTVPPFR